MKKLLIFSTLILCLTTNPKTFSAEEKNEKMYRCIEFCAEDEDEDEKPGYNYYIVENRIVIIEAGIKNKVMENYFPNKDTNSLKKLSANEFKQHLIENRPLDKSFSIFRTNKEEEVIKQIVPAKKIKDMVKDDETNKDMPDNDKSKNYIPTTRLNYLHPREDEEEDYLYDEDYIYDEDEEDLKDYLNNLDDFKEFGYAIVESNITLEQWEKWLENNGKDNSKLKLYNKNTNSFDKLTGDSYREEEKEKYEKTFEEDKYLFPSEKIFNKDIISGNEITYDKDAIFNKYVIFQRIVKKDKKNKTLPKNVPCYILQMKNGKIDTTFFNMEFPRTRPHWPNGLFHMQNITISLDMRDISSQVAKILGVQPKTNKKQKQNTSSSTTRPLISRIGSNTKGDEKPDSISSTISHQEPDNNNNTKGSEKPNSISSLGSHINYHIGAIFIILGATFASLMQKRKKSPQEGKSSNEENDDNTT